MELLVLTVGAIEENCYFLIGENNRDTIIFDPGAEAEEIINVIEVNNLNPFAIVLTHAHYDHIGALNEIRNTYRVPVYQSSIEKDWLIDPMLNGSGRHPEMADVIIEKPADFYLDTVGMHQIGEFKFELQHIPGHSPGSLVFIFKENGFAIVGDVIFQGSVGRTDFPGYGNRETLMKGINEHIVTLPGNTVLFPGHGNPTTVQAEIDTNPFLK
ncbi:MAG TPA: MBL fold metallo-hydrolase [Candidatus Jeotgalibaca pullicola]|nr:MBL fold metallo-hydrolase [Candidatus Jeotgalibaca pullicola]